MARRSADRDCGRALRCCSLPLGFLFYAVANTGRGGLGGYTLHAAFDNVGGISSGGRRAHRRAEGRQRDRTCDRPENPTRRWRRSPCSPDIKLSADDSSATIATGGLLGGNFISLATGGDEKMLGNGGTITVTQSAVNLEDLLGKFIFNVGNLAEALAEADGQALKKQARLRP